MRRGRWSVASRWTALAFLVAACAARLTACAEPTLAHPNVVVLLADDLGWADVGYRDGGGGEAPSTPAIDALARQGVVLERYYSAPMCTPARAGILTGRSPLRAGLTRNLTVHDDAGLPLEEELMSEHFRRAGYQTSMVGKWHLGHARTEQSPTSRGFDHFYGHLTGWIDYLTHERDGVLDWQRDGEPLREEGYTTSLLAAEAARVIRERDQARPLFLYVAFNAPHTPLHIPPGADLGTSEQVDPARQAYRLMVAELDRAVGSIVDTLASEGLERDTIVVFASDNGAHPGYGGSNEPLREGKYSVFEGGIRVPALVAWPGHLAPGRSTTVVSHLDLLPTLARAAGIALAPKLLLDGRDAWDALSGKAELPERIVCFGVERADELRFAALDGGWKVVEVTSKETGVTTRLAFDVGADEREEREQSEENDPRSIGLRDEIARWRAMPRLPFGGTKDR